MGIGGRLQYFMSLTSKWVSERRGCHCGIEVFGEKEEGQLLARAQIEMMHCSPSLQLELTVIKCLIVASWEFVLNISFSVMIIWVWVGRGCNHLGWLFDEILGLVVVRYGRFKCPSGFLLYVQAFSDCYYPSLVLIWWIMGCNFLILYIFL